MKYLSKFAVASIVGASILGSSYAAAPTGGYAPGETLEPDCAPNETDCHIKFQTRLSDKDGDTYVETEAAADQDYLRFYTKGVDMFTITNAASYSRKPLIGQSYVRSQINRADTSNGSNGITGQLILDGKHGTKYARWDLHNWNDHGTPKYNGLAFYKYIDKNGDGDGSDAGESGIGMFLDNDSRLGIATAAPTERLDVNGDARVRGHLHANNRIINNHSSPTYDVWIQG